MPDYRLFFHNAEGHFMRAEVVDVADDASALAKARELDHAHCIEVWQGNDDYDLQAQLVTSAWTRAMGIAAIIGMAVGTLGVGLIFITFRETRAGNTIAERQVEAARDATSKQLRAYIGVLKANAFYIGSAAPRVIAEIKNFGLTPAYGVVSMTRLYIDTHQTGFPGKSDKGGTVTFTTEFGIMEPGQERLIWVNLPEDWIKENIEALRAKTHRLFAETRINYTDLDNLSRYRHFCYFLPDLIHRERGGGAMHMPITGHGNVDGWAKFESDERA